MQRLRRKIRKKIRRKIRSKIWGRIDIPDITIPCTIFTNKGKSRIAFYKQQSIKVCIANYHNNKKEIKEKWPECVNCSKWIPYLPIDYYKDVFGEGEDEFIPTSSTKIKKGRRRKKIK